MGALVEKWRPIAGFEGYYEVSNYGNVRSVDRIVKCKNGTYKHLKGQLMKKVDGNGLGNYEAVCLCKGNNARRYLIHRLVADAFLPNPNNLPEVNHIDENKRNNIVTNLEWCDRKYNNHFNDLKYRIAAKQGIPVLQVKDGKIINGYPSEGIAALCTGAAQSGISACLRGECKTSGGYQWVKAPWAE